MEEKLKFIQKSELLKALAHPTRLCIVKDLMEKESNVTNIQECLDLPQSTVSQHLFKLKAAGIIKGERKFQFFQFVYRHSRTYCCCKNIYSFVNAFVSYNLSS